MTFKCPRCGVEHDYSTREGLKLVIAHLFWHNQEDLGFTNTSEGNMRYAEGAIEWFDGKWGDEFDYYDELVDSGYAQFAPYYLAYREALDAGSVA